MPKKGLYSDQYGFHQSSLVLGCDKESPSLSQHGTLTTNGIDGAQPRRFTAERSGNPAAPDPQDGVGIPTRVKVPLRPRNPLAPDYHLPPVPPPPVVTTKFLRDPLNVAGGWAGASVAGLAASCTGGEGKGRTVRRVKHGLGQALFIPAPLLLRRHRRGSQARIQSSNQAEHVLEYG